jgi:hypothetical protein
MIVGVGSWMVATAVLARSSGKMPHGVGMSLAGASYVGYPLWAFWLGRRLLAW